MHSQCAASPAAALLQELLPPLWHTEMPLVRVIVDMEAAGIGVDEAALQAGKQGGATRQGGKQGSGELEGWGGQGRGTGRAQGES